MATVQELGARVKATTSAIAQASTTQKNDALAFAAAQIDKSRPEILEANRQDVDAGRKAGITETVLDRLRLDNGRLDSMINGLELVASLPDPVGDITQGWVRPNGVQISKVRVPLGVIGVIYENRPNVTCDAAALCLKSGNASLLRGSSAAINSNTAISNALRKGIVEAGLPADVVVLIDDVSRESAVEFMKLRGVIDCLIPRGGPSLIQSILDNATVPYVIDGDGNCHIYVDKSADLDMALNIVKNAKTQRPSVCNAAESLIVHRDVATEFLPMLSALPQVSFVADKQAIDLIPGAEPATDEDFGTEFLDLKMSVGVVNDVDAAIDWIAKYGSGHSEAIISRDVESINKFKRRVDAAAVVVNASTRFVDGEQFGFGAEIGISTQKLHARGPLGLTQLTTEKYILEGNGQTRE